MKNQSGQLREQLLEKALLKISAEETPEEESDADEKDLEMLSKLEQARMDVKQEIWVLKVKDLRQRAKTTGLTG